MSALARPDGRSLDVLAVEIRNAHGLVEDSARSTVEHAIRAGELLIEAKAQVRHGEWLPYLTQTGIPQKTANNYMRLAANQPRVADLGSVREALAELAEPRAVPELEVEAVEVEIVEPTATVTEPDDVQLSIIEQTREHKGEDVARAVAESMNVTYPEAPLVVVPDDEEQEPEGAEHEDAEVVDAEPVEEPPTPARVKCPTCGHLVKPDDFKRGI